MGFFFFFPDLSKFSEAFKVELSMSDGPPLAKPVYSHQGLDNVDSLCKQLFPGRSARYFHGLVGLRRGSHGHGQT